MSFSSKFVQPLLIYDDKCSSCTKFAKSAAKISRGWIRIAGHYYSQEAIDTKKTIFPSNYEATKMFWLINKNGAYGARLGLFHVIIEVLIGNFKNLLKNQYNKDSNKQVREICNYNDRVSCMSKRMTIVRLFTMLKNSAEFKF